MSNATIIILFVVLVIGFGGLVIFLFAQLRKAQGTQDTAIFSSLKQDVEAVRKSVEESARFNASQIQNSLQQSSQAYANLAKEIGNLQEIGRGMKEVEMFLKSPKLRGNLGEQVLQSMLEQVLPRANYDLQYKFANGQVVDAIIKINQGILSVDSKFPSENFQKIILAETQEEKENYKNLFKRDVKKYIEDVAKKYILPSEGTVDFALVYIPSEAAYYEVVVNLPEILEYGYQKRIYFVSPNTFYYFLRTVLLGLEGARIEEVSRNILASVHTLQIETQKFGKDLGVLTSHVTNAKNVTDRVNKSFENLENKVLAIADLKIGDAKGQEKLE